MSQLVVVNSMTAHRANVIARRTGSAAMGVVKAQMIDLLKAKLQSGVAHFVYMKKDGTIREAWGSNVKSDKSSVIIRYGDQRWDTGRKKCGAMVGDRAEIGCNTVLNPGTIVCRDATVYPVNCVRGVVPAGHIYKNAQTIVMKRSE